MGRPTYPMSVSTGWWEMQLTGVKELTGEVAHAIDDMEEQGG